MIAERHPWLIKASQWDERKHPRDKGKFSSSQGARGSEKPQSADIRHNPDLDAVFAEPAQAKPQAKPQGDMRRNTALDEFMGLEGWNSPRKPDPVKVASDAAAKIGQQFAFGKPHKVKDFIAALRQHPPEVIQAICAKAGIVKTDTPRDVVSKFYKAFGGKVKASFSGRGRPSRTGADTPMVVYDRDGKPAGEFYDENVAARHAAKIGGQYGFKGDSQRYSPKSSGGGTNQQQRPSPGQSGKDTPFVVYDKSGKAIGEYQDENVAAREAKRAGGQYGFKGESQRYSPKQGTPSSPPKLPKRSGPPPLPGSSKSNVSPPKLPKHQAEASRAIRQIGSVFPVKDVAATHRKLEGKLRQMSPQARKRFMAITGIDERDDPKTALRKVREAYSDARSAMYRKGVHPWLHKSALAGSKN